jgi:hypothetical protein
MKKLILLLTIILLSMTVKAQSTCASPLIMTNGSCVTNQAIPGNSGLSAGGCSPDKYLYIRFTAGSCNQFTVDMNGGNQAEGLFYILDNSCSYVSGTAVCGENVLANVPFVLDANGVSLTVGAQYVMVLGVNFPNVAGNPVVQTFDICFQSSVSESASNECAGALSLGTTSTTFFNGGNCSFSGSLNDVTTSDPSAIQLCAGSLENTQWVKFQPQAGVSSFQIVGSNINCTGGGCGFQFGIFSGSCSTLTSEGCYGNKVCSGGQSTQGPTNTSATDGFSISWSGTSTTGFTATITKTGGGAFTGTEVFYLVMDGNAAADCQYVLTGINVANLPIELVSFTGENNGDYNLLKWLTATEINNDYFTLEKSIDAVTFDIVGFVDGSGNSTMNKNYSFIDNHPYGPLTYYRLRQTDFNGDNELSEIIAVSRSSNDENFNVIKITNVLGQEVNEDSEGIKIYYFSNGTVLKRYDMKER